MFSWETIFPLEYSAYIQYFFWGGAFSFTNSTHFQNDLGQHLSSSNSITEVFSYICNAIRLFCDILQPFLEFLTT